MSEQYMGEIRAVSFNFAPRGWALCNGQLMAISQNNALFALLGVQFGGDGIRTFGLPNMQGRTPVSSPAQMGLASGTESVTMTINELPKHTHTVQASTTTTNTVSDPTGMVWSQVVDSNGDINNAFTENAADCTMDPTALTPAGASQPIPVMQPYTVINYIIALQGIFPSRG
jgi:microcystin-dependent protein